MIREYIIKDKLGTGSYGVVYKVTKKTDHNIYVLKQISLFGLSKTQIDEVKNEAKILSQLNSDYVVKYFDSFEEKNFLNIVMEFCDNGDLGGFLERQKKTGRLLEEDVIWQLFIKTCLGIAYLHKRKILHRDLKSLNIFLTKGLEVKIGDLGVAKVLSQTNFAKTFIGTPYYLSPEICEERPYNEKSDVWALGCILYELCALRHPFNANSQGALILKIMNGKFDAIPSQYSPEIKKMIELMLQKNDKVRPSVFDIIKRKGFLAKAKSYGLINSLKQISPEIEAIISPKPTFHDLDKKMKESEHIQVVNLEFNGDTNPNTKMNGNYFKGNKVIIKKMERPISSKGNMIQIKRKANITPTNNNMSQNSNVAEGGNGVIQIPNQEIKKKNIKIIPSKKEEFIPDASDAFKRRADINKCSEEYEKYYNKNQQMVKKYNELVQPYKVEQEPNNNNETNKSKKIILTKCKITKKEDEDNNINTPTAKPIENDISNHNINRTKESVSAFVQELNSKKEKDIPKELPLNNQQKNIIDISNADTNQTMSDIYELEANTKNAQIKLNYYNKQRNPIPLIANKNPAIQVKQKEVQKKEELIIDTNSLDDNFAIIENQNCLPGKNDNVNYDSEEDIQVHPNDNYSDDEGNDEDETVKEYIVSENDDDEIVQASEIVQDSDVPIKKSLLQRKKSLTDKLTDIRNDIARLIGEKDAKMIYELYQTIDTIKDNEDNVCEKIQEFINRNYHAKETEFTNLYCSLITNDIQLKGNKLELDKLNE